MSNNLYEQKKPVAYVKNTRGYNPRTYVSIQDRVNSEPDFRREYFNKMAQEGWSELEDPTDIFKVKPGTQIKYRVAPHKRISQDDYGFKSGGFYLRPGSNMTFLYYKGFNGVQFSLQMDDIESLYIKQK